MKSVSINLSKYKSSVLTIDEALELVEKIRKDVNFAKEQQAKLDLESLGCRKFRTTDCIKVSR